MARAATVLIGVQARSTSERLPDKCRMMIADKTMIEHVMDICLCAAEFINTRKDKMKIHCDVALLIPEGDPLGQFDRRYETIYGSESDVLGRYVRGFEAYYPDYIARVTGDCPLIPEYVITTLIRESVYNNADYTTNIIPEIRTEPDGFDCEILSAKLLSWLDANATGKDDREHVTTYLQHSRPEWVRVSPSIGYIDLSHLKYSVDTPEDLDRVRRKYVDLQRKLEIAQSIKGKIIRL